MNKYAKNGGSLQVCKMDKYRLLAERGAVYIAGGAGSDDSAVMCPTPLSRQKNPVFSTSKNLNFSRFVETKIQELKTLKVSE